MKKIAIYTIISQNLGNRLQNYAVQKVLTDLGCHTETFRRTKKSIVIYIKYTLHLLLKRDRFKNYFLFNKKMIKWSNIYINRESIFRNTNSQYDYFIIGSDQVWNPEFPFSSRNDYLPFIDNKPIVAYAASFGVDKITENRETIASDLQRMKALSVREEAGANIIKELTGRDATVLIDPTLMLSAEEWLKVSKAPKKVDCSKPYILTYFLGGRSDKTKDECNKIAQENELVVYHLLDKESPELYAVGPSEFIYLVSHAKLILTDSFHACVFSFLFQKPFLVYAREDYGDSMMSRLDTLFNTFDLKRKYANSGLVNNLFESNYAVGYEKLKEERKRAISFLKKALED